MIITKEQQEVIIDKYTKENPSTDALVGFMEGINATLELVDKILKQNK